MFVKLSPDSGRERPSIDTLTITWLQLLFHTSYSGRFGTSCVAVSRSTCGSSGACALLVRSTPDRVPSDHPDSSPSEASRALACHPEEETHISVVAVWQK